MHVLLLCVVQASLAVYVWDCIAVGAQDRLQSLALATRSAAHLWLRQMQTYHIPSASTACLTTAVSTCCRCMPATMILAQPSQIPCSAASRSLCSCRAKQRCETYVCTAAELTYAHEAWRHLDPGPCLLPVQELHKRIVSVGKGVKTLERTLSIDVTRAVVTARSPFAVVIDDRPEVLQPAWDRTEARSTVQALALGQGAVLMAGLPQWALLQHGDLAASHPAYQ